MDIDLIAEMKKYNEFFACYKEGDEKKTYDGVSLLFNSLSNTDLESRYLISTFLLDKGTCVNQINDQKENLLHVLLQRPNHDLNQTIELCKRLIEKGVDINQIDNRGRVPLQYIVNMKFSDEELEPLYDMWFSHDVVIVNHKNVFGKSPLELAEMRPYRTKLVERMKKYE